MLKAFWNKHSLFRPVLLRLARHTTTPVCAPFYRRVSLVNVNPVMKRAVGAMRRERMHTGCLFSTQDP